MRKKAKNNRSDKKVVPPIEYRNPNEKRQCKEERMTDMNWRMLEYYVKDPSIGLYGAYKKAGYKGVGAAGVNSASQISRKAAFRRELNKIRRKQASKARMTDGELLDWIDSGIRVNIKWYFNADGTAKKIHELSDEAADALGSLEVLEIGKDGQILKIKQLNKVALAKLSMQERGLLTEKLEVDDKRPVSIEVVVSDKIHRKFSDGEGEDGE